MRRSGIPFITALLAGVLMEMPAPAITININGSDFTNGLNSQVIGGLHWTSTPGKFQKKTVGGFTGVGISGGRTGDEIDVGEVLTATTTGLPFRVYSFTLGALFDGPEFSDVQEVAKVTIKSISQGVLSYTLTNTWDPDPLVHDSAIWTGSGVLANLSPSTATGGAVWKITNPFGPIQDIVWIQFTALNGVCGNGPCTNQSDFTLVKLSYAPVPEPGSAALLGTAAIVLGLLVRRRKARGGRRAGQPE